MSGQPLLIDRLAVALRRLHVAIIQISRVGFDTPAMDKRAYGAWIELNEAQVEAARVLVELNHE